MRDGHPCERAGEQHDGGDEQRGHRFRAAGAVGDDAQVDARQQAPAGGRAARAGGGAARGAASARAETAWMLRRLYLGYLRRHGTTAP
jgi:hypothetical protein